MSLDSFRSRATISVDGRTYTIYRLDALASIAGSASARLPVTLKVLLENLLRNEDDAFVKRADIETLAKWDPKAGSRATRR
jgi:aconitate hydratase